MIHKETINGINITIYGDNKAEIDQKRKKLGLVPEASEDSPKIATKTSREMK